MLVKEDGVNYQPKREAAFSEPYYEKSPVVSPPSSLPPYSARRSSICMLEKGIYSSIVDRRGNQIIHLHYSIGLCCLILNTWAYIYQQHFFDIHCVLNMVGSICNPVDIIYRYQTCIIEKLWVCFTTTVPKITIRLCTMHYNTPIHLHFKFIKI